ncbi:MAG: hypothetical protein BGN92_01445 [Sphingobacteriales bacterium 41-5]|nr:MAG: hypothetical protein BGN92_01445 [Sphingobacteriales bacterium 41-5]
MIRKVIIGALALFVTAGAVNAQTQFGIKGGFNAANMTNDNGSTTDTKRLPTFHAGVVADLGITEMFSVRTGLDLQSKGWKYTYGSTEYSSNPLYLELPVNFTVNFPVANSVKMYVGAGPYVAYGVGGKVKATSGSSSVDDKINFTKEQTVASWIPGREYKPLDAGANVIGGVTFNNKFGINLQYGLGMVNTVPESSNDNKANKHRVFGVGGVFYF